ncbi:MAG: hypothetical protein ACPHRO_06780 [Nannocystaceae bacterium]
MTTPLVLAIGLIVVPSIPSGKWGALKPLVTPWFKVLRVCSFSQSWRMYTPDANLSYTRGVVTGRSVTGKEVVLRGPDAVDRVPAGGVFFWNRDRDDFWTYQAAHVGAKRRSGNRLWYMRGWCVRAARMGHELRSVTLTRVNWRLENPLKVRAGKPPLRTPKIKEFRATRCDVGIVHDMILADEEAHRRHE